MTREVHCEDAIEWLRGRDELAGASVVTSLPDVSGLGGMSVDDYRDWLTRTSALVLERTPGVGHTRIVRDPAAIARGLEFLAELAGKSAAA